MILSLNRLFRKNEPYNNLVVLNSFSLKFPKATSILWQQIDTSKSQVSFILKKNKCTALYDSRGLWLETVTLMPFNKIPKQLQLVLTEEHNSDELKNIYYIQNTDRSLYEVSLNNGLYKFKLLFNLSGKIIGKVLL